VLKKKVRMARVGEAVTDATLCLMASGYQNKEDMMYRTPSIFLTMNFIIKLY
jgi:hypothetical protein